MNELKYIMKYLAINFFPMLLTLTACYMIYADKPNWGWLLVVASLYIVYPKKEDY